ncbi:hypothetical protein PN447_04485 [Anabaena sp. CS-542/02]|nr:hypothetical protein [Anabaena sp. CS-542/02]
MYPIREAIALIPNESHISHHLDNLAGFNRLELSDRGFNPWLLLQGDRPNLYGFPPLSTVLPCPPSLALTTM